LHFLHGKYLLVYRHRLIFIIAEFYSSSTIAYYTRPNILHFQYYLFELCIVPIQLGILYLREKCLYHLFRFHTACMSFSRRCPLIVEREFVNTETFYGYPSDRLATTALPDWRRFHTKRNAQVLHLGGSAVRLVTTPLTLRSILTLNRKKKG
jgi:hypothetical protein